MSLPSRFRDHLLDLGVPEAGARVVVAVSGGLDSTVLLHLLRFTPDLPNFELVPAHLDHRMRPRSREDACWLRGLLRAWRLEGRFGRLDDPPGDEAEARRQRYRFLRRVGSEVDADRILLAHHADDQAETVLFRILRGTGLRGLRGIPERREPDILRPLLPFWRRELETYADARGIRTRTDPSNRDRRFARNVIRHELLPRAEEAVAPGARRALVRLARLAAGEEEGWRSVEDRLLDEVLSEPRREGTDASFVLDRPTFLAYHPSVRARLIRRLAREFGVRLDEAGTREAVEFTSFGASGRRLELPDGIGLSRDFDRLVLGPEPERGTDEVLLIPGAGAGRGTFTVGGRRMRASWSVHTEPSGSWVGHFSPSNLHFPLRLRGWKPGDRLRFSYGSKKLKKVFGEQRVPVEMRHRWPVLVDAEGSVLWLPDLARSIVAVPGEGEENVFAIGIADVDDV